MISTREGPDICQICNREIIDGSSVPRMSDDEKEGKAHRQCENSTNPYMQYNKSGEPYLTFKGQYMMGIKSMIFLACIIWAKLKGENIFDDTTDRKESE